MHDQRRHADGRKDIADVDLLVHAVQTLKHARACCQADVVDERFDLVVVLHPELAHGRASLWPRAVHLESLVDLALIRVLASPPRVIRRPHCAGRATANDQCRGPFGIGRREQDAHRGTLGKAVEGGTLRTHRIHHRADIIHTRLQTGGAGHRVGHTRSTLVEADQARERPQVGQKLRKARQLPLELHVCHEAGNEYEVERAVAGQLVRDVDVAAQRVPCLRLHPRILTHHSTAPGSGHCQLARLRSTTRSRLPIAFPQETRGRERREGQTPQKRVDSGGGRRSPAPRWITAYPSMGPGGVGRAFATATPTRPGSTVGASSSATWGRMRASACAAEVDAIRRTAGRVPVPTIVQVDEAECVVTFHRLPGRHGQELIDEGHGDRVLEAAGRTLRSLHAGSQPPTWTHGDYGLQNLLYDGATLEVNGVLDWEFARRGDPIDDLAWAEWIVRMHHPGAATSLGHLFQGWGEQPAWDRRQAAMLSACHRFRDRAKHLGDRPAAALWARRAGITVDWRA